MGKSNAEAHEGPIERFEWWLLFKGDRLAITAGAIVGVFAVTVALVRLDAIAVGEASYMQQVVSGVIAGLLTLVTVTLTINQLILSRLFGTPRELSDTLEGSRDFREAIADLADRHSAPIEPADFLALIGDTLYERATSLQEELGEGGRDRQEASDRLSDIIAEADTLRDIDSEQTNSIEVLDIILGSRHAQNLSTADHLQGKYEGKLSDATQDDLDAVRDLLEGVAIARQHYKTMMLQQTLTQLSRYVSYFGFTAIVIALLVPLIYRNQASPMIDPQYLPWVASASIAISIAPLVVFLAFILRIATVSQYTLSVGAFVPPVKKLREE